MEPNKVECPRCQTVLKTDKPLRLGQRARCPTCGARFAFGAVLQGPNWKVVWLIVLAAVLFLGGGGVLAVYCFNPELLGIHAQQAQEDPDKGRPRDDADGDRSKTDPGKKIVEHQPDPLKAKAKKPPAPLSHQQQLEVDKAIERGVAYLKAVQRPDGTYAAEGENLPNNPAGLATLVGLTLLECDVRKDDAAVQKVAAYLRGREASDEKLTRTYELALALLFFDRLGAARDQSLIPRLALRLVAGQTFSGGWGYTCPVLSDEDSRALAVLLEQTKTDVTANLTTARVTLKAVDPARLRLDANTPASETITKLNVWRGEVAVGESDASDNSNTQFAILALWVAKSHEVAVQRSLALVVDRFHKTQNPDGSWGYNLFGDRKNIDVTSGGPRAMTCAGLLGLAVGQGLVNEARTNSQQRKPAAQQDPAIQRGLDFLARHVGDPHKPWQNASGAAWVNLYFLWSLERVGVIYGLDKIGGKDWYGWGAEILVANQTINGAQGSWQASTFYDAYPPVNTSLALLFLRRANLARNLTQRLMVEE